MKDFGREAFFFAQQAQEEMFRTNVLVAEALSLFRAIRQHAFALVAQGEIDRRRHLFAYCRMSFDLFSDRFDCRVRPQDAVCKRLVDVVERRARLIDALRRRELRGRRRRIGLRDRAEAEQAHGEDRQKPWDEPGQKSDQETLPG